MKDCFQENYIADKLWGLVRKVNDDYYPINRLWTAAIPIVNLRHPDDVGVGRLNDCDTRFTSSHTFLKF